MPTNVEPSAVLDLIVSAVLLAGALIAYLAAARTCRLLEEPELRDGFAACRRLNRAMAVVMAVVTAVAFARFVQAAAACILG